jgi:hypothetical protein
MPAVINLKAKTMGKIWRTRHAELGTGYYNILRGKEM